MSIALSPHPDHDDWLVAEGNHLSVVKSGAKGIEPIIELPGLAGELELVTFPGWACIAERFGTRAVLVNLATGHSRQFSREDHHAKHSSYSVAFVELDARTVLIAQTQWNRLDFFDVVTGELLTPRQIDPETKTNYRDYFHSRLSVSPDGGHFVSNGWVWHPLDVLLCFSTRRFLDEGEPSGCEIMGVGYNWDRPICWVDSHTLVVAESVGEEPEDRHEPFHPFAIHRLPLPEGRNWERSGVIDLEIFPMDQYGEVKGLLGYVPSRDWLVAITPSDGTTAFTVQGEPQVMLPDIHYDQGWRFAQDREVCYRWNRECNTVETRPLN